MSVAIYKEQEIEIEVACDECGKLLDAIFKTDTIYVKPCTTCISESSPETPNA